MFARIEVYTVYTSNVDEVVLQCFEREVLDNATLDLDLLEVSSLAILVQGMQA